MNANTRLWPVLLTTSAERDIRDIVRWTEARFGIVQARTYADKLSDALAALADGPGVADARARDDIARGLFTLHVARGTQRGRHFVLFRINHDQNGEFIEVLRLLHDAMDLARHLPDPD